MQPNDLLAIRRQLGMSQAVFGQALGLTGTYIGLMERGEKGIELRTAETAKALLAEHFPQPRLDVSFSRALAAWTVTVVSTGANPPRRIHEVLKAEAAYQDALSFAMQIKEERYPLADVRTYPKVQQPS